MGYGFFPLSQLEIEIRYLEVPIKAHLDFTLVADHPQPTVRILEVKSTVRLPPTLSESYAMQIGGQTALLKAYWNHPVFNLVLDTGKSSTTEHSLKSVKNSLTYPFLMMLQLATFKGGFSACPCMMQRPLARFFLKIRMLPDVWIWLQNSGRR